MGRVVDASLALLIPSLILLHLYFAPYTKVEESFNIQAVHDLLSYGIPTKLVGLKLREHYDHLTFTGAVPRTFVGSTALAGVSWPLTRVFEDINGQLIVRAVLGLFNAFCLIYYRNGVANAFGRSTANWYTAFQATGFHVIYYASRTLPNFFAFGLTTISLRNLLPTRQGSSSPAPSRYPLALILLTIAGVVFRSEIALLIGAQTLWNLLFRRRFALSTVILSGAVGLILGLSLTIPIDSFFWQQSPLWPELSAFKYNILQSRSADWGTSPWHFYLTSSLPRLLFNPITYTLYIPFALANPVLRSPAADLLLPNLAFVAAYSLQPHKEWRFVVYIVPPLLTSAALAAAWIWTRRAKSPAYRALSLALVVSTAASLAASTAMLAVSRLNYPGAEALNRLHALAPDRDTAIAHVHMDTLACMTGITRFLQLPPPPAAVLEGAAPAGPRVAAGAGELFWVYDKTEDEDKLLDPVFWERFDYALAERPERVIGRWEVVDTVEAFAGFRVVRPGERKEGDNGNWESVRRGAWGEGMVEAWGLVERFGRKATGGWWVEVRMEPRVRVLKKQREKLQNQVGGDW